MRIPLRLLAGLLVLLPLLLLACISAFSSGGQSEKQKEVSSAVSRYQSVPVNPAPLNYAYQGIWNIQLQLPDGSTSGAAVLGPGSPEQPGGGGSMCCASIPAQWQPGLKVQVRWLRDGHPFDSNLCKDVEWLQAEVTLPKYDGETASDLYIRFAADDRVMVDVGTKEEYGTQRTAPIKDGPHWVTGVKDEERAAAHAIPPDQCVIPPP